jgi:hypothetical protein
MDDSGALDITDPFVLLQFQLLGVQPPSPLDGQCAPDETIDALEECETLNCNYIADVDSEIAPWKARRVWCGLIAVPVGRSCGIFPASRPA